MNKKQPCLRQSNIESKISTPVVSEKKKKKKKEEC